LQRVVERESLVNDPEFGTARAPKTDGQSSPGIFSRLYSAFRPQENAEPRAKIREPTASDITNSVESLKRAVSVSRAGQALVLSIYVTSTDPNRAATLANAVAEAYVVDKLDARYEAAKKASTWLSSRLTELRQQLHDSEEAVVNFRNQHGLEASPSATFEQQQLAELNVRLVAAKTEVAEKQARVNLLASLETQDSAQQLPPDLANAGILSTLRAQEASISQRIAELSARYSEQHPLVVNARAEQRDTRRAIGTEIQRLVASMKGDLEMAKARADAVERSTQEVTGQAGLDNATAIALRELERTAAVNKTLFEDFLQRSRITEEEATFQVRDVRVLSPALPPSAPSSPQKRRLMIMSLVAGLSLGAGGAWAKQKLKTGFTTPQQVEIDLKLPLLASVNRFEQADLTINGKVIPIWHIPVMKPLSRHSEAMRVLRLGIQMSDVDEQPKLVQLTSAVPGEGKTTIALALASSAATSGLKVLFVDADLRHPAASRMLGLAGQPGLVDLLVRHPSIGKAITYDEQKVITHDEETNFWVLPAGSQTQNSADLLCSDRMKTLLENLRSSFDYVVVDTPPIGAVIDPLVASRLVDRVLVVVRWESTARTLVKHAIRQLPTDKKLAGIVYSMVDGRAARKYTTCLPSEDKYLKNYYSG
jgi:capsular exopolysaccharide synthesis family protein